MFHIAISDRRRPVLAFDAQDISFSQDGMDLLLSAQGKMSALDTTALQEVQHGTHPCAVTITKDDGETALDALFQVHFFEVKSEMLIARLVAN